VVASGILATGALGFVDTARGFVTDLASFRQLTGITTYNTVVLTLEDSSKIDAVANEIRASFPNVDVISPQAILQTINSFLTSFQLFLGLIAGVSTLITALWLYDTMSINVVQRTKEIGVLRSLGFKKRHIMAMFLGEALMIAIIGVVIGAVLLIPLTQMGLPFMNSAQTPQTRGPGPGGFGGPAFANINSLVLDPVLVAGAAALVVGINLLGAFLPAYRGGRINIVEALRYE
jgi:ABC-type transport system, involved in lipoprotein release, permease component